MDARAWGRWWRLEGQAGLRHVLNTLWNPIGPGLPEDEFDFVAGPIASLLFRDADRSQVAALLAEHRVDHLGAGTDREADDRAAAAILAWYHSVRPRDANPTS